MNATVTCYIVSHQRCFRTEVRYSLDIGTWREAIPYATYRLREFEPGEEERVVGSMGRSSVGAWCGKYGEWVESELGARSGTGSGNPDV